MARADDPAFGQGARPSRSRADYDRPVTPATNFDPRRRPLASTHRDAVEEFYAEPTRAEGNREAATRRRMADPQASTAHGTAYGHDGGYATAPVPPTRSRQSIQPNAEQSYVPQFDRYQPQRSAASAAPPPRSGGSPRLDPAQFGGHAPPPAPSRLAPDPRAGYQRSSTPQAAMQAPAQGHLPPSRAQQRFEPQFQDDFAADEFQPDFEQTQSVAAGYGRRAAPMTAPVPTRQMPALAPQPLASQSAARQRPSDWGGQDDVDDILDDGDAPFEDQEEEFELDDEDQPPPRGRRLIMALGAIGVAVLLGAGIGFGYKMFGGSGADPGVVPVAEADVTPAKTKVDESAAGTKSVYRLGGETAETSTLAATAEQPIAAVSQASTGDVPLTGPRKVSTVEIRPGETIAAAAESPASPGGEQQIALSEDVPGISLGPVGDAPEAAAPASAKVKNAAVAPVEPVAPAESVADGAGSAQPAVPATKPVAPKKVKVATAKPAAPQDAGETLDGPALSEAEAPTAPVQVAKPAKAAKPAASGAGGYVAQIKASKSRVDALGSFADIAQRYAEVLGNAQPDIQEANLGDKGIWYRLRIGPPVSRKSAGDLCAQLKARGMKECIVVAF